ncbi:lipopolysaccharide biosynthesis protein [Hymenobacter sp. BT730]|uniref:lipopolysaccharide biosynthesis protein n=1 Tax=Hymenobacter sp. BT730 TaxID=3063332 RepID=UPI0026E0A464|nr:polysaccharide biosynthesis C-terminal domain-containing protein [Hymenobacter sp. BT730]
MLQRILHNFATRLLSALLSFGVVWLTARYLGATGRGQVSLFVTDCAALLLFIGLLGGSSLIYLAPRRNVWHLLLPAYGWALLVCAGGTAAVGLLRSVPVPYLLHLWALSLLQAFLSVNTLLLLGRRREQAYNLLSILQVLLLAAALLIAFTLFRQRTLQVYFQVAYLAYGLPLLLSFGWLLRLPGAPMGEAPLRGTMRELARHSREAHLSNILAFINYRLSYYFVAHFASAQAVGVLSVGVALAEAIWMIPRSTALVQYVELVQAEDKPAQVQQALRITRLTLLLTTVAIVILCALPPALLSLVFGHEFDSARPIILLLAPGVVAIALSQICSTYFAAVARYRFNNAATLLGVVVTLIGCVTVVPIWGIKGAALLMSVSYSCSALYLVRAFFRATGIRLRDLLPVRADAIYAWQLLRPAQSTPATVEKAT